MTTATTFLNKPKRLTVFLLAILMLVLSVGSPFAYADEVAGSQKYEAESPEPESGSYDGYLETYNSYSATSTEIVRRGNEFTSAEENSVDADKAKDILGEGTSGIYTNETGSVLWTFEVPKDALYNIEVLYHTVQGKGAAVERNIRIDGEIPFEESKNLTLDRVFQDILVDGKFESDYIGNDLRPKQKELFGSRAVRLTDPLGFYSKPFLFAFSAGTHTIELVAIREPVIIESITLKPRENLISYEEYTNKNAQAGYKEYTGDIVTSTEGEFPTLRSQAMNYPVADSSSPNTSPSDVYKTLYNTIGGAKWATSGEWLEWEVDAPEAGLYKLALRYKQDLQAGLFVSRRLYVNGEVPFEEANSIKMHYNTSWQYSALGNGVSGSGAVEYLFYLDKGTNTIRLEAVLGEMADALHTIEDILSKLNEDYLQILRLTGPEPDLYRDYEFDKLMPTVVEDLTLQSNRLYEVVDALKKNAKISGEQLKILEKIAYQSQKMGEKHKTIAASFKALKANLGSLATWLMSAKSQPLAVDYISVVPPQAKLPKGDAGVFSRIWFEIMKFVASFKVDTDALQQKYEFETGENAEPLSVWVGTGRDQAQIIRGMIDDTFTPYYKFPVEIKLVGTSAGAATGGMEDVLLGAVVAGVGPDVSMGLGEGHPVNFAARSAVADLKQFPDFDEVVQRFHPSAMRAYGFNGGVYGLPEAQTYRMFFYRTDLFERYNLKVPNTWDELYTLITELKKENMEFGMPGDFGTMLLLMGQQGEEIYKDGGRSINIDSDIGIGAFKTMCDFYSQYKLPIAYDFANRFRTGEMPAAIVDYVSYNQLAVFAPEIKGKWEMVPIPGFLNVDANGNEYIDRTVINSTTAMVIFKANGKQEQIDKGWEFLKWWTSADTQTQFGFEMESLLGPAAKYNTANMEAFSRLPWQKQEYEMLRDQLDQAIGMPVYPGDYMLARAVNFAFMKVYDKKANPNEILLEYIDSINNELERKRVEFGLD